MGTPEVEHYIDGLTGKKLSKVKGVKYRKTTGKVGSSDNHLLIMGISVKFEVKMKDRQSAGQKLYQQLQELSKGEYHIVRCMADVFAHYDRITANDTYEAKCERVKVMAEIMRQYDEIKRKRKQPTVPQGSITNIEQL
jgi:hypothetical protein